MTEIAAMAIEDPMCAPYVVSGIPARLHASFSRTPFPIHLDSSYRNLVAGVPHRMRSRMDRVGNDIH